MHGNAENSGEEEFVSISDSDLKTSEQERSYGYAGGSSLCEPLTAEEERKGFSKVDKGNAVIQIRDDDNVSDSPTREEDRRSLGIVELLEEVWLRIKAKIAKDRAFHDIKNGVGSSHEPKKKIGSKRKKTLLMWEVCQIRNDLWVSAYDIVNAELDVVNEESNEIAEPPPDLLIPLLRYQKEWLAWALKQEGSESRGGILGDEMGMGKTIQGIALVLAKRAIRQSICESNEPSHSTSSSAALPETKCTLVISPMAAMKHWESEIYKFTPKGSTRVYTMDPKGRRV